METSLAEELKMTGQGRGIPCLVAWNIAKKHKVTRGVVGAAMDDLEIRVIDCQLGCFGTHKATHEELAGRKPAEPLRTEISTSLKEDRLPCAVAHSLARKLKMSPGQVGDTATLMSVKISQCQLGCF